MDQAIQIFYKKSLNDILKSTQKNIDLIICGHTFLSDEEGNISTLIPEINLKNSTSIPKIFILNKEYVNLKFKLDFIKETNLTSVLLIIIIIKRTLK